MSSILPNSLMNALAEPSRRTRETVERLSEEMASRRASDAGEAVRHDFTALAKAERDLGLATALKHSVEAGRRLAEGAGRSLDRIMAEVDALREASTPWVSGSSYPRAEVVADAAGTALAETVAALNVAVDGRTVFAGGRADADATAPFADIAADLDALAAAAPDVASLRADVAAYFAPGGGFEASRIPPGAPAVVTLRTGEDETVSFGQSPTDPEMRTVLATFAEAYAVATSPFGDTDAARDYYTGDVAVALTRASDAAVSQRARVGALEARIGRAAEVVEATRFDAEERRDALIGVDPYETAVRLEDETARLETVYTLTARLSRLRLTDYL